MTHVFSASSSHLALYGHASSGFSTVSSRNLGSYGTGGSMDPAPVSSCRPAQCHAANATDTAASSISPAGTATDAAASATGPAADDCQLTISCIFQYCVHGPQHVPFVISILSKDGFLLEFLPASFQADKQVVMAAVTTSGSALQFASAALREDKSVVLAAISDDPFALEYAGATCKADAQVVLEAVRQDISTMHLADNKLSCDRQFLLDAVAADPTAVTFAAPELLADPAFQADALRANSMVVHYFINTEFSPSLQSLNHPSRSCKLHRLHMPAGCSQQQSVTSGANGALTDPQLNSSCSTAALQPRGENKDSNDNT